MDTSDSIGNTRVGNQDIDILKDVGNHDVGNKSVGNKNIDTRCR